MARRRGQETCAVGGACCVDGSGGSAPRDRTQPRPMARRVLHADPNGAPTFGGNPDALSGRQSAHVLLGAGSDFGGGVWRASVDASAAGGGVRRWLHASALLPRARVDLASGSAAGDNAVDRFVPSRLVFARRAWLHWDALLDATVHYLSPARIARREAAELDNLRRGGIVRHLHPPDDGVCGSKTRGNLRMAAALSREGRRLSAGKLEAAGDGNYVRWPAHAVVVRSGGVAGATILQPSLKAGGSFHASLGVLGNPARLTNWARGGSGGGSGRCFVCRWAGQLLATIRSGGCIASVARVGYSGGRSVDARDDVSTILFLPTGFRIAYSGARGDGDGCGTGRQNESGSPKARKRAHMGHGTGRFADRGFGCFVGAKLPLPQAGLLRSTSVCGSSTGNRRTRGDGGWNRLCLQGILQATLDAGGKCCAA